MRKALNILVIVLFGTLGGWLGYWLGHAAGWSENAVWPGQVGGGAGAILTSICLSVLFVALAAAALFYLPQRRVRHVLESRVTAPATVIGVSETGAVLRTRRGYRRQVRCDLEVCASDTAPYRARAVQFVDEATQCYLGPGARVAVRIEPEAPGHVAIDETLSRAA